MYPEKAFYVFYWEGIFTKWFLVTFLSDGFFIKANPIGFEPTISGLWIRVFKPLQWYHWHLQYAQMRSRKQTQPNIFQRSWIPVAFVTDSVFVVNHTGFEPTTLALWVGASNHPDTLKLYFNEKIEHWYSSLCGKSCFSTGYAALLANREGGLLLRWERLR